MAQRVSPGSSLPLMSRPIDRHAPLEEFARIAPQVPVSASRPRPQQTNLQVENPHRGTRATPWLRATPILPFGVAPADRLDAPGTRPIRVWRSRSAWRASPRITLHGLDGGFATISALPVSADDASGSAVAYSAGAVLVLGVPESAPCPLIAAVFRERVGGSGTGREPGRRSRRLVGVLDAAARGADHARRAGGRKGRGFVWGVLPVECLPFCPGVTSRGGRGWEERGSQPYLGPRGAGAAPATR